VSPVDVLQVITSASARGAERYATLLEPELATRGLRLRTVALHPGSNPTLDVAILGQTKLGLATLRSLRRACREASVVVAHGSATLPATAIAIAGTGVPFVYRNIGDPAYWASNLRRRLQTRVLMGRASELVALTTEAANRIVEHYRIKAERIVVIPNGVPAEQFPLRTPAERAAARAALSIGPDRLVAVYLGALSPEKDVPSAVRAVLGLPDRWMLLIGGEGQQQGEIERLLHGVGPDRVRLLGHVPDPLSLLRAADVLVLPSLTEGLPGVIIEAAMVGVPSVATDTGFVRDLVQDGVNGYVVPVADTHALAAALVRTEPDLQRLGTAAHERSARQFDLATTANQWRVLLGRYLTPSEAWIAPGSP
jgi:glycosyltransferase involved in cell wall biosynthesis